ncbi:MAG: EpsG family protein [Erysipelotrichales bacterium]|nr:MAG: EpsG family protein [Erysipelotrichales bacterium]
MYYLVFLIPILLHPLKIGNRIKGIISSIALGLIAVLRFGSGADYFSYSYVYYLTSETSFLKVLKSLGDIEVGWKMLMFSFRVFSIRYEVFIAFIAIALIVMVYLWIDRNVKSVSLAYLVYYSFFFLVWNLSALRQGLALTIGFFLLYNESFHWKFKTRFLIIIGLSFIHVSSLFFLVFLIADKFKWDKKRLTYVVLISLFVSILPVSQIAILVAKVPFLSKVAVYINASTVQVGFWDIKSLPRLFFILLVLYHYDKLLGKGSISERYLHTFIIGLSFFFFLRFDDLIAARLSIYGFFTIILILPPILDLYQKRKWITVGANLAFVVMCALYLEKELITMATQGGMPKNGYYVPYISVFQENSVNFTNLYYYENNYRDFLDTETCVLNMYNFANNHVYEPSTIQNYARYLAVKFPNGKYGLIDTDGHVVLDGGFGPIEYYGGIIRESASLYYNYKGQPLDAKKASMIFFTARAQTRKYITTSLTWFEVGQQELGDDLVDLLEEEGRFKFLYIVNQIQPLDFYVMAYLSNEHGRVYRLYSKDIEALSSDYFLDAQSILANRVVMARNVCGTNFYNEDGKLIWMQLNS